MEYTKDKPLRVFEAFAGYGSQSLALKRLKEHYPQFDYVAVGFSEIEKSAIIAYQALHGDVKNYGDICTIDWEQVPDFDLFTYSFPCQDISAAGQQRGLKKGEGTRSGLLWECEKAIRIKRPKYLMLENVKALLSKKFINDYKDWVSLLASYGYETFTEIINAKNMGVPQNRERVFGISILKTEEDPAPKFSFPKPFKLELRLKDVLEEKVDEKYYLSDKMLEYFNRVNDDQSHGHDFKPTDGGGTSFAIRTAPGQRVDDTFVKSEE